MCISRHGQACIVCIFRNYQDFTSLFTEERCLDVNMTLSTVMDSRDGCLDVNMTLSTVMEWSGFNNAVATNFF